MIDLSLFQEYIADLSEMINLSLFAPDYIVGISRDGLVPAVVISSKFNIPLIPISWDEDPKLKDHSLRVVQLLNQGYNILIIDAFYNPEKINDLINFWASSTTHFIRDKIYVCTLSADKIKPDFYATDEKDLEYFWDII